MRMVESVLAVYPATDMVSMKAAMSSRFQPKL